METEIQPKAPHENGAKVEESSIELAGEIKEQEKEEVTSMKTRRSRRTRSRSKTPQITKEDKNEENLKSKKEEKKEKKNASPSLATIEEDLNGHSEKMTTRSDNKDKKSSEQIKKKDDNPVEANLEDSKKSNDISNEEGVEVKEIKKTPTKSPKKRDKQEENDTKSSLNQEENIIKSPKRNESGKHSPKKTECEVLESELQPKTNDNHKSDGDDMDPLIIGSDEPDPELQFDETSDLESEKGSPMQLRCKTRRSHTRNIPTPKTPKSLDSDSDKNSMPATPDILDSDCGKPENLNDTNDSLNVQDISTRVEVGSDVTRLDYMAHLDSSILEDESYYNSIRERSIRNLSARKPIRHSDSYRVRALRNNQARSELTFDEDDSISKSIDLKRKRSVSPENRKKFKSSSPSIGYIFSSPLKGFSGRFLSEESSSTPKLTAYKDQNKDIHQDVDEHLENNGEDKRNWCSIM